MNTRKFIGIAAWGIFLFTSGCVYERWRDIHQQAEANVPAKIEAAQPAYWISSSSLEDGSEPDSSPTYHDTEIGETRLQHIRERLAATSCPWTTDGKVVGWWGGEQPGVEIYHWNLDPDGNGGEGHAIADFHQGPYDAGGNAINDARFAAHACADIQFLLDELSKVKAR